LDRHSQTTERTILRLLLGALGGVILVVAIGIGGYRFYQQWESSRQVRRAEAYLTGGEVRSAALAARRAFALKPSNVEACRILARIAERDGQSAAIQWRQAAVAARPRSIDDAIALARTALRFNQIAVAEAALTKLGGTAAKVATYHEVAAQLAVTKKDPVTAERHYAEAAGLDPANRRYQLNLAVFQLQSRSPEVRAKASKLLQTLTNDETLRVQAARALRDYAAQRQDGPALLEVSALLHSYPEATFPDRISYVQLLHLLERPEFAGKLTELQNEAAVDSTKLTQLLEWMSANQLALLAIHWIKELPAEMVKKRPVPAAVADCYMAASDWDGLLQWCKKTNWGDLKFLSHAYLSRALREQGDILGSKSEWNMALQEAGSDGRRIYSLEQSMVKWGWNTEAEALLWILANNPDTQNEAVAALYQFYFDKGDTGNLYRVAAQACKMRPNDEAAQNNLVQLSLLLQMDMDHAHELAIRLYQRDSRNPVLASTYGFSLYEKGRYQEAVQAMDQLNPADLAKPAIAAYYGIFLAAAGNKSKAAEYLRIGAGAPLLPEEKTLLQAAQEKIEHGRP
jgi:cytochrome c-type biogenesis protein CcmH/NrfG